MKKFILILLLVVFSVPAYSAEEFTGDLKLSCEALLCLSSPYRPGECAPSLSRYFGISKKKLSDTLRARINFLNICPASSEVGNLVDIIVDAQDYCDVESLNNKNLVQIYRLYDKSTKTYGNWIIPQRRGTGFISSGGTEYPLCTEYDYEDNYYGEWGYYYPKCAETKTIVDSRLPKVCQDLYNSSYTDYSALKYDSNKNIFYYEK